MAEEKVLTPVAVDAFAEAAYEAKLDIADPDGKEYTKSEAEPMPVPLGMDWIELKMHRVSLPDTKENVIAYRLDFSFDGGKTWPIGNASSAAGGDSIDPRGNPIDWSGLVGGLPEPDNPSRMIRVSMTPMKNITTKLEIIFSKRGGK